MEPSAESFGEIKFTLGSKIRLTISEKPVVPPPPRPASEQGKPPQGPHIVTALSQADCLQIWEEARKANKLNQLMALFEKSNKALLQRLKDNTMTTRDETFMVNLLCQTGVIRMKRLINPSGADSSAKKMSISIPNSTSVGPVASATVTSSNAGPSHDGSEAGSSMGGIHEGLDHSIASSPSTSVSASLGVAEDRSETGTPSFRWVKAEPGLIKTESEEEEEEIGEYHVVAEGEEDESGLALKEEGWGNDDGGESETSESRQDVEQSEDSQQSSNDFANIQIKQEPE